MEYLLVGKYVNTHGIKGEIRVISDLEQKDEVFKKDREIYIGEDKLLFKIKEYRKHKQFDMLTFYNIDTINDIENLKNSLIYINKDNLNLNLINNLIGYKVYIKNKYIGNVIDIIKTKANDVLVVSDRRLLIPYVDSFILKIDNKNKEVVVNDVKGLIS